MNALYSIVAAAPDKSIVAVGDFNVPDVTWKATAAGWAEPMMARRTRRALELLDGCHLAGLTQHVALPSRGPSYLDLVLSNGLNITTTVRDGVFSSDHSEVWCDVRAVRGPVPVVSRNTALNYKRADWDGLRTVLSLTPWSVLDDLPVDDAVALFYDLLSAAISDHIPLVHLRRRQPPWFDRALHAALREKEAAHRRMKRDRTAETIEWFRVKRRDFKKLSSAKFYDYLKGLTDDLRTNPKRFWTFLKSIKGKHSEMSYLIDGDQKVEDDSAKAELLNRTFATKFSDPTVYDFPPTPDYPVDQLCSFHVSEEIVRETLRSVDRHKACGPDNISGRVVRECADELAVPVAKLCRLSFEQGVFPHHWKCANVPMHKKGAKSIAANYRSVSLLPIFSKVLERIVFTNLYEHVKPVLSDCQHGFIPGRSCATNLCTMLETAWSNISAGSQTDVIYTDYSSAFQSVNHKLLLHKLKFSFHVSDQALNWFTSYLSGRKQRVVVKGKASQWTNVLSGTPEGGLLSPLLFACFINDLPASMHTECLLFADDVKLYGRVDSEADVEFMQRQLDSLCDWSKTWCLALNPAKCKVLTLTLRRKPVVSAYLIGGVLLEKVSIMRDLGVMIDGKLTFSDHVDRTVTKANRALGLLMRSFQTGKNGRSLRNFNVKAMISTYCATVRSVLEFSSVVWSGAADSHLKRIERVQHKFLMWLCGRSHVGDVSFNYAELLNFYGLSTLESRRKQHDVMFIRNVHCHVVKSTFLLEKLPVAVPSRLLRNRALFHVPNARVNTVKNGLFCRVPKLCNEFLDANRDIDVWCDSLAAFKKRLIAHVRNQSML